MRDNKNKDGYNEIVLVLTDCLINDSGDFVHCLDCGELQLAQIGCTACCDCESERLEWVITEKHIWSIEELKQTGYIIVEK